MPQPNPPHTWPRLFRSKLATKRGSGVGTRRSAPTAYLSDIRCCQVLPLDPTQQQESTARGLSIDGQVFCDPADIRAEDIVTVDDNTDEFAVVEVAKWPMTTPRVMHLTLRLYQG